MRKKALMSLADHKSTQREELATLKKLFVYLWLSYMASTPSLHRRVYRLSDVSCLHISGGLSLPVILLYVTFSENLKKREIEMKLNQAYETVSLPSPSKPATQVHTKPRPAYENVVQARQ